MKARARKAHFGVKRIGASWRTGCGRSVREDWRTPIHCSYLSMVTCRQCRASRAMRACEVLRDVETAFK